MTTYRGLSEQNIELVREFRGNLIQAIGRRNSSVAFDDVFCKIDAECVNQAMSFASNVQLGTSYEGSIDSEVSVETAIDFINGTKMGGFDVSPIRAKNWFLIYRGEAEVRKLNVVFQSAVEHSLTSREMDSCAPDSIMNGASIGIDGYDMEKYGLRKYTDYLTSPLLRNFN